MLKTVCYKIQANIKKTVVTWTPPAGMYTSLHHRYKKHVQRLQEVLISLYVIHLRESLPVTGFVCLLDCLGYGRSSKRLSVCSL